jgi:hypothetical protein
MAFAGRQSQTEHATHTTYNIQHNTQHTTHNSQHTTHNTQHTTHNTQHTTHNTTHNSQLTRIRHIHNTHSRPSTTPMKEMHNESVGERERANEYVFACARARWGEGCQGCLRASTRECVHACGCTKPRRQTHTHTRNTAVAHDRIAKHFLIVLGPRHLQIAGGSRQTKKRPLARSPARPLARSQTCMHARTHTHTNACVRNLTSNKLDKVCT